MGYRSTVNRVNYRKPETNEIDPINSFEPDKSLYCRFSSFLVQARDRLSAVFTIKQNYCPCRLKIRLESTFGVHAVRTSNGEIKFTQTQLSNLRDAIQLL